MDAYTSKARDHGAVTVAAGYIAESFKWVVKLIPAAGLLSAAELKVAGAEPRLRAVENLDLQIRTVASCWR